jgi:hypothetical protein
LLPSETYLTWTEGVSGEGDRLCEPERERERERESGGDVKVTGEECMYCCNEGSCNLYCQPHIIMAFKQRSVRWTGCVAHVGATKMHTTFFVGRCEGKGPFGRRRRGWDSDNKRNLRIRV